MRFLHYELDVRPGGRVSIKLSRQANVRLMSDNDYHNYVAGRRYSYIGGRVLQSPFVLAPQPGSWHLVIDMQGLAGTVSAQVNLI